MRSEQKDLHSRTTPAIRRDPAVNTRIRQDSRSLPPHFLFSHGHGTAHHGSSTRSIVHPAAVAEAGRLSLTIQAKALCRPAQSHGWWRCRRPPRLGRPRTHGRLTSVPMEPRIRPSACLGTVPARPPAPRRCISRNGTSDVWACSVHEAHRARTGTCGARACGGTAVRHHTNTPDGPGRKTARSRGPDGRRPRSAAADGPSASARARATVDIDRSMDGSEQLGVGLEARKIWI